MIMQQVEKVKIYSSLMGIFDFMGVPISVLTYIAGITGILYLVTQTFFVLFIGVVLWLIAKMFTKRDPYLIDLVIKNMYESDIVVE